jgi:ABC-type nitrate/sulfonate/bicarbonate transport system permease component
VDRELIVVIADADTPGARRMDWRRDPRLAQVVLVLVVAGVWETIARSGVVSPLVFPSLSDSLAALWKSAGSAELFRHARLTIVEILLAFVIGASAGVVGGVVIGANRSLRDVFEPLVLLAYSIPIATLIPFFVILFGLGVGSKTAFGAVYAFFPVVINTLAGLASVDRTHLTLARSLGATRAQTLWSIVLPAAFPAMVSGLQGGMSLAIIGVVASEMFASEAGLGYLMDFAYTMLQTPKVYAMVGATLTLAFALNVVFRAATSYALRRAHHYQPTVDG